jgi:hypothetical protein
MGKSSVSMSMMFATSAAIAFYKREDKYVPFIQVHSIR